ncbi:hypothetical protein BC833DRAFT_599982 [Globomyces pollinis-pini]|nr:hypothetical protein BC833DRAFT_599982 [Globomyces pollinis-pini]
MKSSEYGRRTTQDSEELEEEDNTSFFSGLVKKVTSKSNNRRISVIHDFGLQSVNEEPVAIDVADTENDRNTTKSIDKTHLHSNNRLGSGDENESNGKLFNKKSTNGLDIGYQASNSELQSLASKSAHLTLQPRNSMHSHVTNHSRFKQRKSRASFMPTSPARSLSEEFIPVANPADSARRIMVSKTAKLLNLKYSVVAFILNIILYLFFQLSIQNEGLILSGVGMLFRNSYHVVLQVWMVLIHIFVYWSLKKGLEIHVAFLLTQKQGYSISILGFCHCSLFEKFRFSNNLAWSSKLRPYTSKLSLIWIFHFCLLLTTPLIASVVKESAPYKQIGLKTCKVYTDESGLHDRGYPTLSSSFGEAYNLLTAAAGNMRAEGNDLDHSVFMIPAFPHKDWPTGDKNIIIHGMGISLDIKSECKCSSGTTANDFINDGINSTIATEIENLFATDTSIRSAVNSYSFTDNQFSVLTVLKGFRACGGLGNGFMSICHTNANNLHYRFIVANYINGRSDFNNFLKSVMWDPEEDDQAEYPANYTQFYESLLITHGKTFLVELPGFQVSTLNPFLWGASTDRTVVTPSSLDAGMELMISLLFRNAILRSYPTSEYPCEYFLRTEPDIQFYLSKYWFYLCLVFCLGEFLILFISIYWISQWFRSDSLIYPALQFCQNQNYFMLKLIGHPTVVDQIHSEISTHEIWTHFDKVGRVGETVETITEDKGMIILGKPSLVQSLKKNRLYY